MRLDLKNGSMSCSRVIWILAGGGGEGEGSGSLPHKKSGAKSEMWQMTCMSMPQVKWLCHFSRHSRDEVDTVSQMMQLPPLLLSPPPSPPLLLSPPPSPPLLYSFEISFNMLMTAALLRYLF
jgi:hypothetical protein